MNKCYNSSGNSLQELLCRFTQKINENVILVNSQEERIKYLLNQGVELEVANKIDVMYQKGKLFDVSTLKVVNVKKEMERGNVKPDLATWLQTLLDKDSTPLRIVFQGGSEYIFSSKVKLRSNVTIEGDGAYTTLVSKKDGVFYSSDGVRFVNIKNIALKGSKLPGEYGINIHGGRNGSAKLILTNLFVNNFGEDGIFLTNCWDSAIDNVNSSSNGKIGFNIVDSFSTHIKKMVAYNNGTIGLYMKNPSGSEITGNSQENKNEGVLLESSVGCFYQLYLEQNGYEGSGASKSQLRMTQVPGGQVSTGNIINVYAIGGKGTNMSSDYGVYLQYAYNNTISGCYFNHNKNNIYMTGDSKNNTILNVNKHEGVGNATPSHIVDNGKNYQPARSVKKETLIQTIDEVSTGGAKKVMYPVAYKSKAPTVVGTVRGGNSASAWAIRITEKTKESFTYIVTNGSGYESGRQVDFMVVGEDPLI